MELGEVATPFGVALEGDRVSVSVLGCVGCKDLISRRLIGYKEAAKKKEVRSKG